MLYYCNFFLKNSERLRWVVIIMFTYHTFWKIFYTVNVVSFWLVSFTLSEIICIKYQEIFWVRLSDIWQITFSIVVISKIYDISNNVMNAGCSIPISKNFQVPQGSQTSKFVSTQISHDVQRLILYYHCSHFWRIQHLLKTLKIAKVW